MFSMNEIFLYVFRHPVVPVSVALRDTTSTRCAINVLFVSLWHIHAYTLSMGRRPIFQRAVCAARIGAERCTNADWLMRRHEYVSKHTHTRKIERTKNSKKEKKEKKTKNFSSSSSTATTLCRFFSRTRRSVILNRFLTFFFFCERVRKCKRLHERKRDNKQRNKMPGMNEITVNNSNNASRARVWANERETERTKAKRKYVCVCSDAACSNKKKIKRSPKSLSLTAHGSRMNAARCT